LAEIYASCDVFVHPNPREPFGIAPLEAMASGLALVAPDEGGVTTYANSGNAWPTRAKAEDFAKSIEDAAAGPEREARIEAALETAARYAWPAAAARYFELYDQLVEGGTLAEAEYVSTPGDRFGFEV
jgi:glycosyltransferase involved in cell wall biosynthesis